MNMKQNIHEINKRFDLASLCYDSIKHSIQNNFTYSDDDFSDLQTSLEQLQILFRELKKQMPNERPNEIKK